MIVVADENIPAIDRALEGIGEVRLMPGRQMTQDLVRDADALLVRSVTRVGADLLEGSRVRFVGSATAGLEHVDETWLRDRGIAFASAPGSNADSVAQYVTAALFHARPLFGGRLRGKTIGIVGVGQVGSRVRRAAEALGMEVRLCDPPLARATRDAVYQPLSELTECDIVTLHVPMIESGPDRTRGLIGEDFLERLRPDVLIINTSRGGVIEEGALAKCLEASRLHAVLDVWDGEPLVDKRLYGLCRLGTPHIAGYAADAKLRGTDMVYRALCDAFGMEPKWTAADELPPVAQEIELAAASAEEPEETLDAAIHAAYPIGRDHAALGSTMNLPDAERAAAFDQLRKNYPVRREFAATRLILPDPSSEVARIAKGVGFTVAPAPRSPTL